MDVIDDIITTTATTSSTTSITAMALTQFCCEEGGEEGYKVVLDRILPITAQLLEDEKAEVINKPKARIILVQ